MSSTDSEGFESADEGHNTSEKTSRKHRKSSSNYGDTPLETAEEVPKSARNEAKQTDGWDDFDIEESEPVVTSGEVMKVGDDGKKLDSKTKKKEDGSDQGWDEFDDWGDEGDRDTGPDKSLTNKMAAASITNQSSRTNITNTSTIALNKSKSGPNKGSIGPSKGSIGPNTGSIGPNTGSIGPNTGSIGPNTGSIGPNTGSIGPNASGSGPNSSSWGWGGWGMDSILSTATAGITSLTNQVSASIHTVLESGMGIPDPEELARRPASGPTTTHHAQPDKEHPPQTNSETQSDEAMMKRDETERGEGDGDTFPFGGILKLVGSTGSKVLAGGLDTLETIGRKTMEVLQEGDPGLAKKRAMIGLEQKPVLSVLLREAAARADEEDRVKDHQQEAKDTVHYENLFDDYQGLIHLEALEMLSGQVAMRIEDRLRAANAEQRQEMKETMAQVEELCEIPEDDADLDGSGELLDDLQKATEDLGVKLQFQPLVKQYTEIQTFLNEENLTSKSVYKRAISSLAQTTALSMEIYHKVAEMLLVKPRRSTADEADSLLQMTVVLSKHMSELARIFTEKLNAVSELEQKDGEGQKTAGGDVNSLVTNVFLEAENSSKYLQNALVLELPVIQIGAFGKM